MSRCLEFLQLQELRARIGVGRAGALVPGIRWVVRGWLSIWTS